jgi:hypothetical protein
MAWPVTRERPRGDTPCRTAHPIAIEHHDVPINPGYGAMKAAMIKGVDV